MPQHTRVLVLALVTAADDQQDEGWESFILAHSYRVYSLLLIDSTLSVAEGGKASQKKATGERERGYSL